MSKHRALIERAKHPLEPSWGEIAAACAVPAVVVGVALVAGASPGWVIGGLSGLCMVLAVLVLVLRRRSPQPCAPVGASTGLMSVRFASPAEVDAILADKLPRWQPLLNRLEVAEQAERGIVDPTPWGDGNTWLPAPPPGRWSHHPGSIGYMTPGGSIAMNPAWDRP